MLQPYSATWVTESSRYWLPKYNIFMDPVNEHKEAGAKSKDEVVVVRFIFLRAHFLSMTPHNQRQ